MSKDKKRSMAGTLKTRVNKLRNRVAKNVTLAKIKINEDTPSAVPRPDLDGVYQYRWYSQVLGEVTTFFVVEDGLIGKPIGSIDSPPAQFAGKSLMLFVEARLFEDWPYRNDRLLQVGK